MEGILIEADAVFGLTCSYSSSKASPNPQLESAAEANNTQMPHGALAVTLRLVMRPKGAWTAEVVASTTESPAIPLPIHEVKAPDLFGPMHLYRRFYDRSVEERNHDRVKRWGDLCTLPEDGEDITRFMVDRVPCSLPYCRWGVGKTVVPIHGSQLPPGWCHSRVDAGEGKHISWEPTEPIGVPLKFETVDVSIMGVPKGCPRAPHFTLEQHGFTWIRSGESAEIDRHPWFTDQSIGASLSGTLRDWYTQLWEQGLRTLLVEKISDELGHPVVEISPLIYDMKKRRDRYDAVYQDFLSSAAAEEHGIMTFRQKREYIEDRDLDLTTSSCDQREGRATANEHIPTILELSPVPPPTVENIRDFNRRPPRAGLVASHRAAAWPAHVDLLAEGATSHLLRAAEVGDTLPCDGDCYMPDGVMVPRGVPLRREMMQCWVLRDESITCMPLALFHDFEDGKGPVAVVPQLNTRDIIIWRTGHVLHGALTAVAHGKLVIELGPWEALGAMLTLDGVVARVDAGSRAAALGLCYGDVLVAVDGKNVRSGSIVSALSSARSHACRASGRKIQLTFLLPRYNGRRSIEFRFFVYWPA